MKRLTNSIAGVVVLYNPANNVLDTIFSYSQQVRHLYVIDNSTNKNTDVIQTLGTIDNLSYVDHQGNKGIAAALNRGAEMAIAEGFKFLLTMDQDTKLRNNFVSDLSARLANDDVDQVGIIAPRYTKQSKKNSGRFENVLFTMTSGNILNLAVYEKIGPFLNDLFIDHVDHEYCLRLNKLNYKVIQDNDVEIVHRPGLLRTHKMLPEKFKFSSHSPIRLYYFCRNGFYVSRLYKEQFPAFRRIFLTLLTKEMLKLPFENSLLLRIKMMWKGYHDYRHHKFGSFKS